MLKVLAMPVKGLAWPSSGPLQKGFPGFANASTMLLDHLPHTSVSVMMTNVSLFIEKPPKSESTLSRVQILLAGRLVCAAKAKCASVNARCAANARQMNLRHEFLLRVQ